MVKCVTLLYFGKGKIINSIKNLACCMNKKILDMIPFAFCDLFIYLFFYFFSEIFRGLIEKNRLIKKIYIYGI